MDLANHISLGALDRAEIALAKLAAFPELLDVAVAALEGAAESIDEPRVLAARLARADLRCRELGSALIRVTMNAGPRTRALWLAWAESGAHDPRPSSLDRSIEEQLRLDSIVRRPAVTHSVAACALESDAGLCCSLGCGCECHTLDVEALRP